MWTSLHSTVPFVPPTVCMHDVKPFARVCIRLQMSVEDRIDDAVERYQESKIRQDNSSDEDSDEFLELLDDNEMARIRDERMLQLKREFRAIDRAASTEGFGAIKYVTDEKAVMDTVTKSKDVLVHFYQPDFAKCKTMNERLAVSINERTPERV